MTAPVRTDDQPFAFTRDEAWSGGWRACVAFVVLLVGALVVYTIGAVVVAAFVTIDWWSTLVILLLMVIVAAIIGGGVSFVVMLIGMPLAWLLARGLRRTRAISVHLLVYGLFGGMIGVIAVAAVSASSGYGTGSAFWSPLLPITVAITSTAVMYGWWRASRSARVELRAADPRSPIEVYGVFGDRL